MTISKSNYYKTIEKLDTSSLPETLRKSHELVEKATANGSNWNSYDSNETIKRVLDLYFDKLSEHLKDKAKDRVPPIVDARKSGESNPLPVDNNLSEETKDRLRTIPDLAAIIFKKIGKELQDAYRSKATFTVKDTPIGWTDVSIHQSTDKTYDVTLKQYIGDRLMRTKNKEDLSDAAAYKLLSDELGLDTPNKKSKKDKSGYKAKSRGNKPAPKKAERVKKEVKAKPAPKAKKEAKPKAEPKPKAAPKPEPTQKVESFSEDLKLMKRFLNLVNQIKSYDDILRLYKALKRAITDKKVSKQSKYGAIVHAIQLKVSKLMNTMDEENLKEARVVVTDATFVENIRQILEDIKIYPSIRFIKRFITLEGIKPAVEKASKLLKDIEGALTKGTIKTSDKYIQEIKLIQNALENYISKKKASIELSPSELNGLMGLAGLGGLGCPGECTCGGNGLKGCGCNKTISGLNGGVMTAQQMAERKFDSLKFTGKWAKLMGYPSKNFTLMIHGEPGGGKTTLLLKMAQYLADNFGKVMYVSSEEFAASTLTKKINELLNPIPENLHFSENLQIDLSGYDFCIIDSVNDLGMDLPKYKELRNLYRNTSFIAILQHTKDGQFKGGKEWEHEFEIAGKVVAGEIKIYKNRYGVKGEYEFFNG